MQKAIESGSLNFLMTQFVAVRPFALTIQAKNQLSDKTENPIIPNLPIGLCNKPYTLLRTAGPRGKRFFQQLFTKLNQTIELSHGNQNEMRRHCLVFTSPIAIPTVLRSGFLFRKNYQASISNRPYFPSRFLGLSEDGGRAPTLLSR